MKISMLSDDALLALQKEQFRHDVRNHSDILSLHKIERLKHYGLHFCKYVGRFADENVDPRKGVAPTIVDAFLVCLSAANTLQQRLSLSNRVFPSNCQIDIFRPFATSAGHFADACEKLDHAEFQDVTVMHRANIAILSSLALLASEHDVDIVSGVIQRRKILAERHFYI